MNGFDQRFASQLAGRLANDAQWNLKAAITACVPTAHVTNPIAKAAGKTFHFASGDCEGLLGLSQLFEQLNKRRHRMFPQATKKPLYRMAVTHFTGTNGRSVPNGIESMNTLCPSRGSTGLLSDRG